MTDENLNFYGQPPATWADVNQLFQAYNEAGKDHRRLFSAAMVGCDEKPYGNTIGIVRGMLKVVL